MGSSIRAEQVTQVLDLDCKIGQLGSSRFAQAQVILRNVEWKIAICNLSLLESGHVYRIQCC